MQAAADCPAAAWARIGNPASALDYHVYDHEYLKHITTEMYSGHALSPRDASTDWSWVTFDVPPNFPFKPQCFYISFQTSSGGADGDSCKDCYQISYVGNSGGLAEAMDLTYDGGAHTSRATTSHDGGRHWSDDFSRDLNFVVLGEPCPPISTVPLQLTPTPEHGQ